MKHAFGSIFHSFTIMKVIGTLSLMVAAASALLGQVGSLRYEGKIVDALNGDALVAVDIEISGSEQEQHTVSDTSGLFSFSNLPFGDYTLSIRSLGYESLTIAEVSIHTGVLKKQIFSLMPAQNELQSILVKAASRNRASQSFNSIHTLTVEESFRFPGTFYDPARLATHLPGVINDNDQANNLIIRGNSPNLMGWYLEDVEIVNPNHLSNAGTLNDRSTQSGGGVNILSAQMIDNSAFLKSAFPSSFGNAVSGIMDMHLRDGASDRFHFTGQLGLNGIDAAIEGPLMAKNGGSYLINYRYSTLGLLSAMGVDLGDDQINFQDLSFHVKVPLGSQSSISLFGMGGQSSNKFEGTSDQTLWEELKDRQNIDYDGKMAAVGITVQNQQWKTTLAFSGYSNKRISSLILSEEQVTGFERDLTEEGRISLHTRNRFSLSKKGFLDIGMRINSISYSNLFARDFLEVSNSSKTDAWLLQMYASSRLPLNPKLSIFTGIHLSHFTLSQASAVEPRVGFQQWLTNKSRLNLSYGLHSRIPSQNALFIQDGQGQDNRDLDFIRAHHIVLGYSHQLTSVSKISAEIYYQHLFSLPIGNGNNQSFSTINTIDYIGIQNLVSEGVGNNTGIEIGYEKYFSNSTYYQINTALFDSKYKGADGITRNTRYNAKYAVNVTGGKEFTWKKQHKIKNLGVNIRLYTRGGLWEGPINVDQSQAQLTTIYDEPLAFTEQLPGYFKIDFRVHYKRTKKRYTSILGLDVLNATNQENIAYYFYNATNQSVLPKNHLGIIPILSYRIEY